MKKLICMICLICEAMFGTVCTVEASTWSNEPPKTSIQVRYNTDHTVAAIKIDASAAPQIKEFIDQLQRSGVRDANAVVSMVGSAPELVIMGSSYGVEKLVKVMLSVLDGADKQRNLIVITASLRQLARSDAESIGFSLMPSSISYSVGRQYSAYSNGANSSNGSNSNNTLSTQNAGRIIAQSSNNLVQLDDALNRSQILVSSEVFTPNGLKGGVSSVQRVPVFAMDKNGNINTQYQDLETSIKVTPTLIKYDPEHPEESNVRMDISVKVAIVSGSRSMQSVSAPEYSVKTLTTTQIVRADGANNVVGNFISDSKITSRSGIPLLSEIPLLKYLFSQKTTQNVRDMAVLTLAVRVLPTEEEKRMLEANVRNNNGYYYEDDTNSSTKSNSVRSTAEKLLAMTKETETDKAVKKKVEVSASANRTAAEKIAQEKASEKIALWQEKAESAGGGR